MKDLMDMIKRVNELMAESGFEPKLIIGNDNFKITEKEVTMKLPFVLTVKIPRDSFDGDDASVSRAISQAISHAIEKK